MTSGKRQRMKIDQGTDEETDGRVVISQRVAYTSAKRPLDDRVASMYRCMNRPGQAVGASS